MAKPELVGHDAFYMKELNDMIDIKRDYDFWQARRYFPIVCIEEKLMDDADWRIILGEENCFIL